jgi:hypothetical protein
MTGCWRGSARLMAALTCLAGAVAVMNAVAGPQTLVDPTRPVSASTVTETRVDTQRVQLEAVLNRSGSYVAIVNGRLVRAGDHVGNITIQTVTLEGVRYVQDGKTGFASMAATKLSVRKDVASKKEIP